MSKVIVITGTSSGFGTLMVKTLSRAGYTVVATMRGTLGNNKEAAATLAALPNVAVVELDVANDESVKTGVKAILAKFAKIDVWINNAAIFGSGLLEAYSLKQFQKIMDVNLYGIVRVYQELLPAMRKEQDGLIINVSSNAGRISLPFQIPYNCSKFAIEALTEGGYEELIGQGVETVLVEPGAFLTDLYAKEGTNADKEGLLEAYGEDTILRYTGFGSKMGAKLQIYQPNPQDIADAALKLIEMEKGTRPLRTSVDPIGQGVDQEYNQATSDLRDKWVSKYLS